MSLYIRDPEVDALAEKLQRLTQTKTDAVRAALIEAIARAGADLSFAERNADVLAIADALGPSDLTFASKPFFDDMWGQ